MGEYDDQNTDIYEALLPESPALIPKRLIVTESEQEELIRNGEFKYNLQYWDDTSRENATAEWKSPGKLRITAGDPSTVEKIQNGTFDSDLSYWDNNSQSPATAVWGAGPPARAELTGDEYEGSEEITNGDFATDLSGWTEAVTGDAYTNWQSPGELRLGAGSSGGTAQRYQSFTSVNGQEYDIDITTITGVAGTLALQVGPTSGSSSWLNLDISSATSHNTTFTALGTTCFVTITYSGAEEFGEVDDVSVKALLPAAAQLDQSFSVENGDDYQLTWDILTGSYVGTNAKVRIGTTLGGSEIAEVNCTSVTSYTQPFTAISDTTYVSLYCVEDGGTMLIDNVSCSYEEAQARAQLNQAFEVESGVTYTLSVDIIDRSTTSGVGVIHVGTTFGASNKVNYTVPASQSFPTTYQTTFVGGSTFYFSVKIGLANQWIEFDNISITGPAVDVDTVEGGLWQLLAGMQANDDPIIEDLAELFYIRDPYRTPVLEDLEREYGLSNNTNLTESERRELLAAWVYDTEANGSLDYLQGQLDRAGFISLGPTLITNGLFVSNITGWDTYVTGTGAVAWSSSDGGTMQLSSSGTGTARAEQAITTTIGEEYTVSIKTVASSDYLQLQVGEASATTHYADLDISELGTYSIKFTATWTEAYVGVYYSGDAETARVDNISARETISTLQVHANDPAVDPDQFFDDPDQQYFGDTGVEMGEADVQCSNFGDGFMLVNGYHYYYEIIYLAFLGDTLQQCGEEDAMCGDFSGVGKELIEYPTVFDDEYWPFVFFVGGEATRNAQGELTDIEYAVIPREKMDYAVSLIAKIKPMHTWCGFLVRAGE
jgi:hypothetical protein